MATIRESKTTDISKMSFLLARAFATDPTITHGVGADSRRLERFFRAELSLRYGGRAELDVLEEDGEILGVGIWVGPKVKIPSILHPRLAPVYSKILGKRYLSQVRSNLLDSRYEPRFPHWLAHIVAVDPDAQGRGIGGALLRHGLARAAGSPVYLEATTPGSAALYQRHGFIPLGHFGTNPVQLQTAMWRPHENEG